jgi:hypothetical protein
MTTLMKKKHICGILVALLLCGCQETLEEKAARECQQYTKKNCPAQIDKSTILDSMTFEASTHTLQYHYTLTGAAGSIGLLSDKEVHDALVKEVRNTTMMRMYKEAEYNFRFIYHSQRHPEQVLYEVTLTAKDYQ